MKRKRTILSLAWISVLILGLALTACSDGDGSPSDDIVYYEETKILTEEEAENIEEVTENRTRILFRENTPFVASIEPGDVLVCEYPVPGAEYGFLERVTEVSTMGYGFVEGATGLANGGVVVEVEPATLEDVIEQGVISVNATIPREDLMSDALWTTGVAVLQAEEGYDFSYSPAEGVTIEGYLLVTADVEIYIEAGFFSGLEEFKFIFSPGLEMGVTLTVEESVSWDEKYTIAEIPGPPIPIWGPVTITPSIELVVGTDGEITGILEAGVAYERIYDVGIRYYDGTWSTINEVRGDGATLEPPSFSGQAEAKVYAGAVLSGTAGISYVAEAALRTELLGNIRASGEIETPPWRWQYDLELYLTAQVFADLDLLRIAHVGWESDVWTYPDPPYNLAYGGSGRVTTEGGEGLDGVQINFSGGRSSVTTDADGYWSKHLLMGEVEVTPEKTGYAFEPSSRTVTRSASNIDFSANVLGETVVVQLELLDIPTTLTFQQDFMPDYGCEYEWGTTIDIDNDPNTGDDEGCDVMIILISWKQPGSQPYDATIDEGTYHDTYVWDESGSVWMLTHRNEIDVAVDYASNIITMVAPKAWEELENLDENSRFQFHAFCQIPDGIGFDETSFSQGIGVIDDPMGDGSYDFVDIIQCSLSIEIAP